MNKLRPIGERALVKPVDRESSTASGIVLPETAQQGPLTAKVVAVGNFENGVRVKEGDLIVFAKYSGTRIKLGDEDYLILDADDLLGIVEG